jgi:hypothetical protein
MTPPRDEDASREDFAPVIPLRRQHPDREPRGGTDTVEPDARGVWDNDVPIPGLPQRSSGSEQPSLPEFPDRSRQGRNPVDIGVGEAVPRRRPGSRHSLRHRLAAVTVASVVLAATTVALTVPTRVAPHAKKKQPPASRPVSTLGPSAADTRQSKTATETRSRRPRPTTGVRADRAVQHRSKPATHSHGAIADSTPAGSSHTSAAASLSSVSTSHRPSPVRHTDARTVNATTGGSFAASPCVPGELGC